MSSVHISITAKKSA